MRIEKRTVKTEDNTVLKQQHPKNLTVWKLMRRAIILAQLHCSSLIGLKIGSNKSEQANRCVPSGSLHDDNDFLLHSILFGKFRRFHWHGNGHKYGRMDGQTPYNRDVRTHLKTSQGSSFIFAKQGVKNNIFETFSTNNSNDLHFKRLTFVL